MIFVKLIDGRELESKTSVAEFQLAMREARNSGKPFVMVQETWINVHFIVQYGEAIELPY
jgi:hypothetical protein